MVESSKIKALLSAWLKYIYWENLTNASVEVKKEQQPRVWEEGVSLLGDQLHLDKSLFQDHRQRLLDLKKDYKEGEFQVAVAFPQLYVIEENSRKFCPLFTIDISQIFQGRYRASGWNLTQFEFQPVLPNWRAKNFGGDGVNNAVR